MQASWLVMSDDSCNYFVTQNLFFSYSKLISHVMSRYNSLIMRF